MWSVAVNTMTSRRSSRVCNVAKLGNVRGASTFFETSGIDLYMHEENHEHSDLEGGNVTFELYLFSGSTKMLAYNTTKQALHWWLVPW